MTPRVSVIVATFNYAQFLVDALDSVVKQTASDWECVVVDDGSTDNTPAIAEEWSLEDPRIRYVRQKNRGPSAAYNTGLRHANGEYVQFLDADDRLATTKVETQARYLDEHQEVDIVYGPVGFFRSEEPEKILHSLHGHLSRPLMPHVSSGADALRLLQMFNIMPNVAALVRKSAAQRAGGFNERTRSSEDWDFWLRCATSRSEFHYLDSSAPVALVRTHPRSASRSIDWMLRGQISAAQTWDRQPVPLVYRMAIGIDDVEHGRRRSGIRRIAAAAREARSTLVRMRWLAYAAAAAVLPRKAFTWFVTRPIPERAFELARRLRLQ